MHAGINTDQISFDIEKLDIEFINQIVASIPSVLFYRVDCNCRSVSL